MGSQGSGRLSDYSGQKPGNTSDQSGGESGEDKCGKAFSTELEDVGSSDYYTQNKDVPQTNEIIQITLSKRIVATLDDGTVIGNLPTKFNYLKFCLEDGFEYSGVITNSTNSPIPNISIDVTPSDGSF